MLTTPKLFLALAIGGALALPAHADDLKSVVDQNVRLQREAWQAERNLQKPLTETQQRSREIARLKQEIRENECKLTPGCVLPPPPTGLVEASAPRPRQ